MKWEYRAIKDVYEGLYDGPHATPPVCDDGAIFLGISNISENGHLDFSDIKYISEADLPRWTKRVTPKAGDIVFSYEAGLNRYAIIPEGFHGCLGRRMALIRPNEKKALGKFLYYYFFSAQWRETIAANTIIGTTVDRIPLIKFPKFPVSLPDLNVQRRIVDTLSAYDDLIEVNNKRIKVLEQMAENLYKEWFVRFRFPGHESVPFENGLPKGWTIKRVDAIGEVIGGGTPSTNVESFWDGTIPWLTPADLSNTNRILIRRGSTNISSEGLKRSGATMMPPGTVLVSSRAPVGYLAIAANPICTNQGFKSIVCFEGKTSPYYLFFFLRSNREMLQNYATGATFPELSGNRMKKIKVLVPDIQLQKSFERIAKSIICEMDKLEEANDLLRHQRDLLLPRLMSGKLEV